MLFLLQSLLLIKLDFLIHDFTFNFTQKNTVNENGYKTVDNTFKLGYYVNELRQM